VPSKIFEELLIRADRATVVASLARGMAHDLRGPLQTLTLLVDPHADLLGGPEGANLRASVGDAVQHLAETITCFSQVYAPPDSELAPVIVDDLLAYIVDLQGYQRGLPAVEVELRLQGGLPPVRGIEGQLRHILLGLITNAKQALIGREDGEIVLAGTARDGEVQIVVEDNGPGIPESEWARAFEPFHSTWAEHLGIGLTVARCLAQRYGGSLTLDRPERGGTRVLLKLPSWRRASQAPI
jgi:two-component system C4-dicarboxylate transport sensor histidine kinase DctB